VDKIYNCIGEEIQFDEIDDCGWYKPLNPVIVDSAEIKELKTYDKRLAGFPLYDFDEIEPLTTGTECYQHPFNIGTHTMLILLIKL